MTAPLCPICRERPRAVWERDTINGPHTSRPNMRRRERRVRLTCTHPDCVGRLNHLVRRKKKRKAA